MTNVDLAGVYDARAAIPFDGSTNRGEIEATLALVRALAPSLDTTILDVGCGAGWFLSALAGEGYRRISGIDISAKNLHLAERHCGDTVTNLILGDIATSTIGDFELVTALNACLGCFGPPDDQRFLKGIQGVLKPGGRLLLTYVGPDAARRRAGEYRVRYSAGSPVEVCSQVHIQSGWLIICQTIDGRPVPEERIRIIEAPILKRMLSRAGLEFDAAAVMTEIATALPFVSLALATRPTLSRLAGGLAV
jgi:SAM-dependent methyltransferase